MYYKLVPDLGIYSAVLGCANTLREMMTEYKRSQKDGGTCSGI